MREEKARKKEGGAPVLNSEKAVRVHLNKEGLGV